MQHAQRGARASTKDGGVQTGSLFRHQQNLMSHNTIILIAMPINLRDKREAAKAASGSRTPAVAGSGFARRSGAKIRRAILRRGGQVTGPGTKNGSMSTLSGFRELRKLEGFSWRL